MCDSKTWRSLLFLKSEWLWKKGNSQFDIVTWILKEYKWVFCITFFYKLLGERSHGEFGNNNALQVVFFYCRWNFVSFQQRNWGNFGIFFLV
jgi:hypothetical protein